MTLEKVLDRVQSMCVWMRQRPHMYAQWNCELENGLIWFHNIWAMMTGRQKELDKAFLQFHPYAKQSTTKPILPDELMKEAVDPTSPATMRILRFWEEVDEQLGIVIVCDGWWD